MKRRAGFTLIEIMVSLVLVGLIAAIAGTSVVMGMRGYLFAKENDAITQKAQLAMSRLNRELMELTDIKAVNSSQPYLIYEVPAGVAGSSTDPLRYERRAVAKVGNTLQMFFNVSGTSLPGTGDVLVDRVQSFSILYNGAVTWSGNISQLYAVGIQMGLSRPDTGGTVSFSTTVSPRNNNNAGGAAIPTAANPPPEYGGRQCFVTTAAWGDPDHPIVELLRQFRDRILVHTDFGKAMIRFYYEVGPSLAAAIAGKPLACLIVRLLVLPAAGFAFLALCCPVLIPLIVLFSWGIAHLLLRELRRRSLHWSPRLQGQRGAMLVTLIATMVVFSTLGAVMVGMFGTSAMSQASGNNSVRAYYLAESGFRYAASRYIAVNLGSESANETERNRVLKDDLHNKEFTLGSGDGKFHLYIYPYYYRGLSASTHWLYTEVPGGYPLSSDNYKNGSWIQIKKSDGTLIYRQIQGATLIFPNIVQFQQTGNWDSDMLFTIPSVAPEVTPACLPVNNATLTDVDGDGVPDLRFQADTGAEAFPPRNGVFTVKIQGSSEPRLLAYRELDTTNRLFKGVTDPNGGSVAGLPLETSAGNYVALTKYMRVESSGTFGSGTSAISRKVTYYVPIGYARANPIPRSNFNDTMQDTTFANWRTGDDISRSGTLRAGTSYGTTMRVDTMQVFNQAPGVNCLKFREFQVGLNTTVARLTSGVTVYNGMQQEWLRTGDYLSYDVEMKTYYTLSSPTAKHALGLTFRLDEQGNALGFTFAAGVPGYDMNGCDIDGIPWGWLGDISGYTSYTPVLLFWMKQFPSRYGFGPSDVIYENPTGLSPLPPSTRVLKAVSGFNWPTGTRVRLTNATGTLPTPLTQGTDYYIRVWGTGLNPKYVYFFPDAASAICSGCTADTYWQNLIQITGQGSATNTMIAQDPTFTKLAHQVMNAGNQYYRIYFGPLALLNSWVTFMVRLIEAPSVSFINGTDPSGRGILSGDVVYQTSDNLATGTVTAIYQVARNPVYRSASSTDRIWTGGTAQGAILLERIAGNALSDPAASPFTAGSRIFVVDQPGTLAATVGVPGGYTDESFRVRDNWLLFYVGDPTGNTPADSDPFNNYRGPVFRNSILWPPDNVEDTAANNDYFTLLRFSDYVNASLNCSVNGANRTGTYCLTSFFTKGNTGSAGDALRFASPDGTMFYSPQTGSVFPTGRSEVGLHAYGYDGQFTEYDDFALLFGPGYSITRKGFLLPIQQ
jgi:prepilin-type N-terminal cleavage/methylation domain-containing protein